MNPGTTSASPCVNQPFGSIAAAVAAKNWPQVRAWIKRELREDEDEQRIALWCAAVGGDDWSVGTWRTWFRQRIKAAYTETAQRRCRGCLCYFWVLDRDRRTVCKPACHVAAHRAGRSARGRRKCEWCGEWFAAARKAQRCCSRDHQRKALNRRDRLLKLKASGVSWSNLAGRERVSVATVRKWCQK